MAVTPVISENTEVVPVYLTSKEYADVLATVEKVANTSDAPSYYKGALDYSIYAFYPGQEELDSWENGAFFYSIRDFVFYIYDKPNNTFNVSGFPTYAGEYRSNARYFPKQIVMFENALYVCVAVNNTDVLAGHLLGIDPTDAGYWEPLEITGTGGSGSGTTEPVNFSKHNPVVSLDFTKGQIPVDWYGFTREFALPENYSFFYVNAKGKLSLCTDFTKIGSKGFGFGFVSVPNGTLPTVASSFTVEANATVVDYSGSETPQEDGTPRGVLYSCSAPDTNGMTLNLATLPSLNSKYAFSLLVKELSNKGSFYLKTGIGSKTDTYLVNLAANEGQGAITNWSVVSSGVIPPHIRRLANGWFLITAQYPFTYNAFKIMGSSSGQQLLIHSLVPIFHYSDTSLAEYPIIPVADAGIAALTDSMMWNGMQSLNLAELCAGKTDSITIVAKTYLDFPSTFSVTSKALTPVQVFKLCTVNPSGTPYEMVAGVYANGTLAAPQLATNTTATVTANQGNAPKGFGCMVLTYDANTNTVTVAYNGVKRSYTYPSRVIRFADGLVSLELGNTNFGGICVSIRSLDIWSGSITAEEAVALSLT